MLSIVNEVATEKASWPDLPLETWEDTYDTLHLWTQIVGKIKLEFSPFINHWWNVTLSVSSSGLTTGLIPYGNRGFEILFDFVSHQLVITTTDGKSSFLNLKSGTIADFYFELKGILNSLGIKMNIWPVPVEIDDRTPFDQDFRDRKYNSFYANQYWKILVLVNKVLSIFRSGFKGKTSPVHFFWGSMDLAVTLFSGNPAPLHPGAPNVAKKVTEESYNSELASFGFWGGKGLGAPAFYAYAYPEPTGFNQFRSEPNQAYYNTAFKEFVLPYKAVIESPLPEKSILDFYRSVFLAVAELAHWDESLYKERMV